MMFKVCVADVLVMMGAAGEQDRTHSEMGVDNLQAAPLSPPSSGWPADFHVNQKISIEILDIVLFE